MKRTLSLILIILLLTPSLAGFAQLKPKDPVEIKEAQPIEEPTQFIEIKNYTPLPFQIINQRNDFESVLNKETGELFLFNWEQGGYIVIKTGEQPYTFTKEGINNDLHYQNYKVRVFETPEGNIEYEMILSQYVGNEFVFDIRDIGKLQYHPQPALNPDDYPNDWIVNDTHAFDEKGLMITRRPVNVVDSIAVYNGYNKVFHIYRAKIIDREGDWIYATMDVKDGKLTVSADDTWLRKAVYPVTVDPTFGNTIQGGSSTTFPGTRIRLYRYTAPENGALVSISAYIRSVAGTINFTLGMYNVDGSNDPLNLTAFTASTINNTAGGYWVTFPLSGNFTAGEKYLGHAGAGNFYHWMDAVNTTESHETGAIVWNASWAWADPFPSNSNQVTNIPSIYVTYNGTFAPTSLSHLYAQGNKIENSTGDQIILNGFNKPGFEDNPGGIWNFKNVNNYGQWNATEVQNELNLMAATGANVIRCIVAADYFIDNTQNHTGMLKDLAVWADQRGIYMIYSGYQVRNYFVGGGYGQDDLPVPPYQDNQTLAAPYINNTRDFGRYWEMVAGNFTDYTNLIFELWNEPVANITQWNITAQHAIDSIRANTTAVHPIIVGWGYLTWVNLDYPSPPTPRGDLTWIDDLSITDTENNLFYTAHFYGWDSSYGQYTEPASIALWNATRAWWLPQINASLQWTGYYNFTPIYPIIIGEIGATMAHSAKATEEQVQRHHKELTAYDYTLRLFNSLNMSVVGWWWRNTGIYRLINTSFAYNDVGISLSTYFNTSTPFNRGPVIINVTRPATHNSTEIYNVTASFYDWDSLSYGWVGYTLNGGAQTNVSYTALPDQVNTTTFSFVPTSGAGNLTIILYGNDTLGAEFLSYSYDTIQNPVPVPPPPADDWTDSINALISLLPLFALVFFLGFKAYELRDSPVFILVIATGIFGAVVWIARVNGWI